MLPLSRDARQYAASTNSCSEPIFGLNREEATVQAALEAGANAYIAKSGLPQEVMDAITVVRDGGVYVSPPLPPPPVTDQHKKELFSLMAEGVELQDIDRIMSAEGLTVREIADTLGISSETVAFYRNKWKNRRIDGLAGGPLVIAGDGKPRLPHRPPRAASAEPPEDAHYKIE